jgi:hypothetical protein
VPPWPFCGTALWLSSILRPWWLRVRAFLLLLERNTAFLTEYHLVLLGCLSRLAWPSFNFGWGRSWLSTFSLVQNANGWNHPPPAAICTRTVRWTDRALDRSMIEVKTLGRFQRLTPPAKMTHEERTLLWNRSVQAQLP